MFVRFKRACGLIAEPDLGIALPEDLASCFLTDDRFRIKISLPAGEDIVR